MNKLKGKIWPLVLKTSQVWGIFSFLTCLLIFFVLASTSVFSVFLKTQGNKAYQDQKYNLALEKYETARGWWLAEKISLKLRDRDLHSKINKAKLMVDSGNSYRKGIEAFENGDFVTARKYFSQLVINDPNYQDAQFKIKICDEKFRPTPTPTPKIIPTRSPQTSLKAIPTSSSQPEKQNIKPTEIQRTSINVSGENQNIKATLNSYWNEKERFCVNVTVTNKGVDKTATLTDFCAQAYLSDGSHATNTGVTLASDKMPSANKGETVDYNLCVELFPYPGYKVISIGCGGDSSLRLNIP